MAETTPINKLIEAMEPLASGSSVDTLQSSGLGELVNASIAISLKRIADALEPTNQSGMSSIPESLYRIMWNGMD